jgi:uncharacterized protein with HEPN domain
MPHEKRSHSRRDGRATTSIQTELLLFGLVRCLEIIDEAARQITIERRLADPSIEWSRIIGMRNRVIHEYFDIDIDIVWSTVTVDLPPLIESTQRAIDRE